MSQAVKRPESPDKIDGMYADYRAIRNQLRKDPQGDTIVWIVKRWDEHRCVGEVEVGVTGREPLTVKDQRSGHGKGDNVWFGSVFESHCFEPFTVLLK